ncbi:alpha-glucosidase [Aspergillus sp. HF37]|nr:alpha-glucosidase [Aspergillus sp. HF37]
MAFLAKVLVATAGLLPAVHAASSTSSAANAQYTLPFDSMEGVTMIPNVEVPNRVDAQAVCPGYKASNVQHSSRGLTATLSLAGEPCNVYGTDIATLSLTVDYQAKDRLNIQIIPAHLDASNASFYLIDEDVVPRSQASNGSVSASDLTFSWSNGPSFNFEVTRKATGDVLFSTKNTVVVYENQFIELETSLPEDYNLYGLGEHVQQFRIKENLTLTTWAADAGNVIDE